MGERRNWLVAAVESELLTATFTVGRAVTSDSADESNVGALGARDLGQLLGLAMSQLHSLPASTCPFDASAEAVLNELNQTISSGGAEAVRLPAPYDRYSAGELVEMVETQLGLSSGPELPPVIVHGDLQPQNWIVQDRVGAPVVVLDGLDHLGVGDRHRDLAVLHRYLPTVAGAEALFAFYEAYDTEPDLIRLDAYVLMTILVEQLGLSEIAV